MNTINIGGIQCTNKTPFEIEDMLSEFQNGWTDTLVPTFKLAAELYDNTYEFRTTDADDYNKFVLANCTIRSNPKTFAQAIYIISSAYNVADFCNKFKKHFENGIDIYSLTVADSALINQFSGLQLFLEYSPMLLHYISILECNSYPQSSSLASYGLNKQQIDWLSAQTTNYRKALTIVSTSVDKLYAEIDTLPTTYIVDLNKSGFTADNLGNILKIATLITSTIFGVSAIVQACYWRMSGGSALTIAKVIQRRKQLKNTLQLRLAYLKNLRDHPDEPNSAVLEKNIQITEDRLRKINKELDDLEKKYGV